MGPGRLDRDRMAGPVVAASSLALTVTAIKEVSTRRTRRFAERCLQMSFLNAAVPGPVPGNYERILDRVEGEDRAYGFWRSLQKLVDCHRNLHCHRNLRSERYAAD